MCQHLNTGTNLAVWITFNPHFETPPKIGNNNKRSHGMCFAYALHCSLNLIYWITIRNTTNAQWTTSAPYFIINLLYKPKRPTFHTHTHTQAYTFDDLVTSTSHMHQSSLTRVAAFFVCFHDTSLHRQKVTDKLPTLPCHMAAHIDFTTNTYMHRTHPIGCVICGACLPVAPKVAPVQRVTRTHLCARVSSEMAIFDGYVVALLRRRRPFSTRDDSSSKHVQYGCMCIPKKGLIMSVAAINVNDGAKKECARLKECKSCQLDILASFGNRRQRAVCFKCDHN